MNQRTHDIFSGLPLLILFLFSLPTALKGQMRQVYLDANPDNEIRKISFYSASQGYVAFRDWVGYTTDSGRTFTKKYITNGNVDFNGYSVNLTFGFWISGVKAFSQTNLIVYGHYGFVPAILYSSNSGTTFKLVYQSQYDPFEFKTGITDMAFLPDNLTGYAVDADRIFKTTNGGLTWSVAIPFPASYFTDIQVLDANNIIASSSEYDGNKIVKTSNSGGLWTTLTLPPGTDILSTYFLSSTVGWLSTNDYQVYKTTDGGNTWVLVTDPQIANFFALKMKFVDANTGYSLSDGKRVFKTLNAGLTWEPLPGVNNTTSGFNDNDLFFLNSNQFWAGGRGGYLELTTNTGGTPILKSFFKADTTGVLATNKVNLNNYSRQGYTYKWLVNAVQISTLYSTNYTHNPFHLIDTVSLIVSDGVRADTSTKILFFYPPVIVKSFLPTNGGAGTEIEIRGSNFSGTSSVNFGNTPAASFLILTDTSIRAVVGSGSSGEVRISKANGTGALPGFVFVNPPTIVSCNPMTAAAGTAALITGTNFIGVSSVSFGGITASFNVVNTTTISATIPSGTSGEIKVVTTGGTAVLPGFTAVPTVASFTPGSGTTGTVMTIKGTSFTTVANVSIGGVNALSFTVDDVNTITAVVGTGASGSVVVTSPGGNSSKAGFNWLAAPVINSFAPLSAAAGSSIVISGTSFSNVANNNIVLFGGVKATVTAASNTSLTVTVPYGAAYKPISVSVNNLTGYSKVPFLLTFPNGASISAASFDSVNIATVASEVYPTRVEIKDYDGDGKNDIALQEYSGNFTVPTGLQFFKNNSSGSSLSFQKIAALPVSYYCSFDMDGDGKPDIVSGDENGIYLYRNISSSSSIIFDNGFLISSLYPGGFTVADIDLDGKPDVIGNGIIIYKNISEPGKLQFRAGVQVSSTQSSPNIVVADLDLDGKPEIITGSTVLKNNSSPVSISFVSQQITDQQDISDLLLGGTVAVGDIDGDGKPDISSININKMMVLRNNSSAGTISFIQPLLLAITFSTDIAIADIDGDGKADICLTQSDKKLSVYKNSSTSGNISLQMAASYGIRSFVTQGSISIADIDNDGKNDVVACATAQQQITAFLNKVKPEPFISTISPSIGGTGTTVSISGVNFTGVTSVKFGGIAAASYTVNNATSITAVVGNGSSGAVSVTNSAGTGIYNSFVFGIPPSIDSIKPVTAIPGAVVTIYGKSFSNNLNGNTVFFGGNKAKIVTATANVITAEVPFGSQYTPVTVLTNGLIAYSKTAFTTTFQASNDSLNAQSFASKTDIDFAPSRPIADIDGDGRLDVLLISSSTLRVFLNNSLSGQISFLNGIPVGSLIGYGSLPLTADLDGDGKLDVLLRDGDHMLSVFKNESTVGSVAFDIRRNFIPANNTGYYPTAVSDIDKDGKADILLCSNADHALAVVRNTSNGQGISFEPGIISLPLSGAGTDAFLTDIDGDNKPDIIATSNGGPGFEIYLNNSVPGKISFAPKLAFGSGVGQMVVADLDKDGKTDMVLSVGGSIFIYRNTSVVGTISFASPVNLSTINSLSISVNDLNGDGLPDLLGVKNGLQKLTALKNKSTIGNIVFAATDIDFPLIFSDSYSGSADFDNDGKPDLAVAGAIYRNKSGGTGPTIFSFSPTTATRGTPVNIAGNDFFNATSVSFGNVAADSFFILSNNLMVAYPGNGASGTVVVKSGLNAASKAGFTYSSLPDITQFKPSVATGGTVINIEGSNLSNITSVIFGDTPAKSFTINSATSVTAVVADHSNSGSIKLIAGADTAFTPGFVYKDKPQIFSFDPQTGSNYTNVTITGSNLQGVTGVMVGGMPMQTFTKVSDDTLIVTINQAASGDITITNEVGSASLGLFNYYGAASVTSFYPPVATQGTEVQIVGSNLGSVFWVKFGGVDAASFKLTSPTTITAIVGNAVSGDVSVTNGDGTYTLSGFKYVAANVPGIASFTPARAAGGTVVQISGINFNNITAVSFGGVAATNYTVVSATLIKATVPNNAVSGDVAVTNAGGTARLSSFVFTTTPYISSFYPAAAAVGNTITIYGANFSSVAANNIVYFGPVKATVVSASANRLLVTVPRQATLSKITVTTGGLTAFSARSFIPTFSSKDDLSSNTFRLRADSLYQVGPVDPQLADIDVDGKADITFAGTNLSVIRNTYSPGKLSLAPPATVNNVPLPTKHSCADFNGDGLLDMAAINYDDGNSLFVVKNTSTAGNVSFGTPLVLDPSIGQLDVATSDVNGDGKTDIIAVSPYAGISIFLNTSTLSTISFTQQINYPDQGNYYLSILIEDIDVDGKPDFILFTGAAITIMRNTSTTQAVSFNASTVVILDGYPTGLAAGDFNTDGLPDIVATYNSNNILILENYCKAGGFTYFKVNRNFFTDFVVNVPSVADVNGDGKADVVVSAEKKVVIFKNTGSNSISFDEKFEYAGNGIAGTVTVGDLDGDDRPELITTNGNTVSVFKNFLIAAPAVSAMCSGGNVTFSSNVTGTGYQWQINTGSGYTNLSNSASYSGTNTASLTISNLQTAWYGYSYRCRVQNKYSSEYSLKFVNTWTGASNSFWNNPLNWSCGIVPDGNTDVIISSGAVTLNVSGACRSLSIVPGASLNIAPGYNLTITR